MRRSKAEVHKYIESVQSSTASPREKSMKGFIFAKLYYEAKEYELAKRCVSSYINVQERDPKAHKFLGHLFEIEGNVEKAVGCYKRSVELNPTQKELILRIAELMCTLNVVDGRAKYWVERASKLFPGSPAIFRLKEQLLNSQDEVGWNQLFDLIQSELFVRPDDVFVNIRLVELFRTVKRLDEAVSHCLKPERRVLRSNLEWCSCVVQVLKEYLAVHHGSGSDKSKWRTINKELLLAHVDVVRLTLSTRDVQESKGALENFDQALMSLKRHVSETEMDDLSLTFVEMRGHYYLHAGTLLLKMAQHSEVRWKALIEPAALCYFLALKVPRPKSKPIRGEDNGQDLLEGFACDRQSQSGHLLQMLSHDKPDFMSEVIETFANVNGQSVLLNFLFEGHLTEENSFMGSDDIRDISRELPDILDGSRESTELCRYDYGAVRLHGGNLQHLTWLGLQWHFMDSLPNLRKWLKQLFPRLPQTQRIDGNSPESICMLDLEVFLLAIVHTSHLQLQNKLNASNDEGRPYCLPLPICKQLCADIQQSWWDAVYGLVHGKAIPGTSAKLRLVVQHGLTTVRALEKHGLQPALLIYWARSLYKTGNSLNSFYDQRDYMVRCVHYWKKVVPLLELIKQRRSIPEPVDPLFKHFHSVDIKISEVKGLEDEAHIAFATLDLVDGKIEDAIVMFYEIKNVLSYWNLALIFQRKADDIETDDISEEQAEKYQSYLQKCKQYLVKITDELSDDPSIAVKLPVSIDAVGEMLDLTRQKLGEIPEGRSPDMRESQSFIAASALKHSTPSPSKFIVSPSKTPKFSPKTPPRWAEDQKSLLEILCHQVEALKNEVQELKMNSSNTNASPHRWPSEVYPADNVTDGYQAPQNFYGAPLTVSTSGPPAYYGQSTAYNSQHLLRPAANITPTKTSVYAMNRLAPQPHVYAYPQQMHTPPTQNAAVFPQEIYGAPLRFESPATGILSPHNDEFFNYSVPTASTNPPLPEPGYFTKPSMGLQSAKPDGSKPEFGKASLGQPMPTESSKPSPFLVPLQSTPASSTFKFNSNFKSNDGDFTFSSTHGMAPTSNFTGSESLLGLLTSDKPTQDYGRKSSGFENATDQPNLFRFGDKGFSANFTSSANKSQDKITTPFGQPESFSFQNSGKSTFIPPSFGTQNKDAQNQSLESDGGSEAANDDDGPHFEPVVPLPEKVEVKTGEEDEEEMFCNRGKLFRFDADTKEWKERGIGNVKILRHRVTGKIRLLMRREQVLKICANHYINADMKLKPNAGSDKSYVWHAYDYADEMPKPEQLAIRFKTVDEAALFKVKFEEAQKLLEAAESKADSSKQKTAKETPRVVSKDSAKTIAAKPSFASHFGLKEGEWRCNVCLVQNAATADVCLSCQSPNPSKNSSIKITPGQDSKGSTGPGALNMPASAFTFSKDSTANKIVFGEPFVKSKEQWICSKCSAKNDVQVTNCVSCKNSKQIKTKTDDSLANKTTTSVNVKPSPGSFGSAFVKKAGQWDCSVCLVRNEPSAAKCAACQAPNASSNVQTAAQTASSFKLVSSGSSLQKDFGGMFAKKEGQWDCSTCCVRNEAANLKCVSCQSPNTQVTGNGTAPSVQSASSIKFGTSSDLGNTQNSNLANMFSRKEGQWDCSVCLIRNESSAGSCAACQTPNPSGSSGTANKITSNEPKSSFTFGLKSSSSEPVGQSSTGFKCDFSAKDFKFGITDEKASSFSFKPETKPAKEGFSFSMPANATSFKFGIQEPSKSETQTKEPMAGFKQNVSVEVDASATKVKADTKSAESKPKSSNDIIIGESVEGISFADLAKASAAEGFAFGTTEPNFKAFSRAGEQLFTTQNGKSAQSNTSVEQEHSDELYKTEERDDIHFEPVVQLPEKVDLVTGEEDEKTLYSERVKLFRFDAETSQWKERGVGNLKILKNEVNGKLRMLMRREQVLKVCANHWITTTMNLKPLSGSDRAWMWLASDFSDGDAKLEQLAAKFKTPEQAEAFKNKFEECQRLLLDIPLQTPHKLVDTGRTAHLIKKAEEMKSGLKDLKTFLTDKGKPLDDDSTNVSSSTGPEREPHAERTEATYEWDTYDMRGDSLEGNLDDSVYASPLAGSPEKKNLFRFGDSTTGFNFSFEPVPSPSKSPTKLNQSRVSVGTDDESDVTQEDERDGQYFEPVVPLPDLVEVTSGEENEQTLFCNRAKLYRFDKDTNQWKERGIGDLKILQRYDTKSARVVMRRDQVLKLCANHLITPDINVQPMKGSERAWVWTAHDFAEGDGKVECFAVRFKLQEAADTFKETFEEAKEAQANNRLLTPISSRGTTPKASPCGKAAVAILEETTKERTDQEPEGDSSVSQAESDACSPSEKASKALVSPPKFVFGSDVVKNIFGTEKQKPFAFGNTSSAGTLFGFSFNSSNSQNEEPDQPPKLIPSLQFTSASQSEVTSTVDQKPSVSTVQNPTVSSSLTGSILTQPMPARAKSSGTAEAESSPEVFIVFELTPTPEQRAMAERLRLPPTFFCYKNKPGYVSEESDVDDEDFETAVKNLNGQLYQEKVSGSSIHLTKDIDKECVIVWEKKPTPEEKAKADSLKLPPTFFCGMTSDPEEEKENTEDFESEVRKVKDGEESRKPEVSSSSDAATPVSAAVVDTSLSKYEEPDSTTGSAQEPVDLSSKIDTVKQDTTSQGIESISFSFGLNNGSGLSFADLASNNSGDFAFGSKDTNFQWANTGATVFGFAQQSQKGENAEDSDDEVVHNDDVHFEPIVSLPEVEVKSGEEDEEILFKERTKLYRWDREANQWKERGVGEIKILYHSEKQYYRVLMRRDQVLKVCANHVISKTMKLSPLNTSNNALVWTATDYSEGEGKVEQLAARFKTQELADSFQRKFEECQDKLSDIPEES
ncbi:E3 SUMO-protein ligase RanBP2-like [Discoglossus pictus]